MRILTTILLALTLLGAALADTGRAAADGSPGWTGWSDASGIPLTGYVDTPAANATLSGGAFMVSGWVVDSTATTSTGVDDVRVFQGPLDTGTILAIATIGQNRPDVFAAEGRLAWLPSGFTATVPAGILGQGSQTLSVYAHTPSRGWWFLQVPVTVGPGPAPAITIPQMGPPPIAGWEHPAPGEIVRTNNPYQLAGYALDLQTDPNGPLGDTAGIDQVQVYFDYPRDGAGVFLGNADLGYSDPVPAALYGPNVATAGWRLTFQPTHFHAMTHALYAYVHSALTGKETMIQTSITIHE